ncbi:hypothetical protein [Oleiagrimonas sp. C23AA]|uniref:hypothetical protein n=1 Tax=Oleiagrimonas sp. C23AA TaxID=2719047 RepID=UPI00141DF12E|nr:hypothetical protein [Oleiagrimonas sp. C23AA]NII09730.1 hypothetical protein [Oleiagrimonas sp. C23AA]
MNPSKDPKNVPDTPVNPQKIPGQHPDRDRREDRLHGPPQPPEHDPAHGEFRKDGDFSKDD